MANIQIAQDTNVAMDADVNIENITPMFASGKRAYTATLYVHKDGSGSDGSSWTEAYTDIQSAVNAASEDNNDFTIIYIGPGTYDVDSATGLDIDGERIALKGAGITLAVVRDTFLSDHCVTVLKVSDRTVTLADPVLGKRLISHEQFEKVWRFSGVVLKRDSTQSI